MGLLKLRTASSKTGLKNRSLTKKEKEAEASFKKMMSEWDKVPKFAGKFQAPVTNRTTTVTKSHRVLENTIASSKRNLQTEQPKKPKFDVGSTAPRKTIQYTGDAMLGVAGTHKSNDIPVFSKQAAEEVAKMRRG